jgi:Phage tail sheath C-terminal domain
MATLQSPGVNVSIIDQSFYAPAGVGTIPLIFIATAKNKQNASGTGTAKGTTDGTLGTVYSITSQRDLVDTFGTPYFDVDSGKNAINGSELSEYGLQTAYSVLGISSRAYVARADIDLNALKGTATIPQGRPTAGIFWLDTTNKTQFGINLWDASLNNGQGGFVNTPVTILDESNIVTTGNNPNVASGLPKSSFGSVGDYAIYLPHQDGTSAITNQARLFYKISSGWVSVISTFDSTKRLQISEHFNYPSTWNSNTATGSVWICTTPINIGASWNLKNYNGDTGQWSTVSAPLYSSRQTAIKNLDSSGGGINIPVNSTFVCYDYDRVVSADFTVLVKENSGPTTFTFASTATFAGNSASFYIRETTKTGDWDSVVTITVGTGVSTKMGSLIADQINGNSSFKQLTANWNATTNILTLTHASGGEVQLTDGNNTPLSLLGLSCTDVIAKNKVRNNTYNNLYIAPSSDTALLSVAAAQNTDQVTYQISNWAPLQYYTKPTAPNNKPADGTLWFDTRMSDVDILWNNGTAWVGYRTVLPDTDPKGPIVSASQPTLQSDNKTALKDGDIWVDSSDPDMYGREIYLYNGTSKQWVKQDVTDHISPSGWVFGDARWSDNGTDDSEYITPITDLLVSSYLDFDAPNPRLYPKGTRLWNTRRSGNVVKQYMVNHVNKNGTNPNSNNEQQTGYDADRWVTVSGMNDHKVSNFGRYAQRSLVTAALKSLVTTNSSIRDTDTLNYNLIATPGYTELIPDMVALNVDIGQTAFVIGDTPLRLEPNGTALQDYGNGKGAISDGDDGLITHDSYLGVYYPSGYTNDNYGRNIVVPPSHMMLRVIVNNDNVSYPWFAPAGTNRGIVNNANSVGYIDGMTGEFKPASLYQGLRDTMATVKINPIATLPGSGLTVMGQYTRSANASSLDRINVARLVNYIRRQLNILSKPFLFEPNDSQTRNEIKRVIEGMMSEMVSQRGLYDYVVVCDSSNNTPTRIDQNQLWVDIAIEPVKAVEFIYIPLRLLNTGAIATGNFGAAFPGSK